MCRLKASEYAHETHTVLSLYYIDQT